ncbi:hypothetical protein J8J42_04630 [Chryseobacterium sp. cx-311]|uniref:hypothetical protein n=1 Tax=Marnyiella aurantia TaxID=2758037 RepID=UPI001AEA20A0|nr:hypothetical protein [Marnyiella aurantia]MBP0612331.1 hypothetical protein [Marnyiella aurantia]
MNFFADSYYLSDTETNFSLQINERMNIYAKNPGDVEHQNLFDVVKLSLDHLLSEILKKGNYEGKISPEMLSEIETFYINEFWSSLNSFRKLEFCQKFILKMRFALKNLIDSNI